MRRKFLALEGLRGILALFVCVGHLGLNTVLERVGVQARIGLAVDVFFALSGFVLCHASYFGRKTASEFAVGRIARLFPLHVATFALMLLIGPGVERVPTTAEFWQQLTLTHNLGWSERMPLNFPAWSISVEVWVSLLFFALLTRRRLWPLVVLALGSLVLLGEPGTHELLNVGGVLNVGVLRGICGFAWGALAYQVYERSPVGVPPLVLYAMLGALAWSFTLRAWPMPTTVAFYLLLFSLLVGLASRDETALTWRPFVWLGTVSYSVYLLHMPVYYLAKLTIGEQSARGGAGKALVIAAVLVASWASHRWLEVPAQRLLMRLLSGKSTPAHERKSPVETADPMSSTAESR